MPAIRPGARGAVISGWGTALPEKVVTNEELAATMDTSDEWIRSRTGIEERRIGGSTVGLSVQSGRQALEMANHITIDLAHGVVSRRYSGRMGAYCAMNLRSPPASKMTVTRKFSPCPSTRRTIPTSFPKIFRSTMIRRKSPCPRISFRNIPGTTAR